MVDASAEDSPYGELPIWSEFIRLSRLRSQQAAVHQPIDQGGRRGEYFLGWEIALLSEPLDDGGEREAGLQEVPGQAAEGVEPVRAAALEIVEHDLKPVPDRDDMPGPAE